jgi:phosphoribosyl-ATP pyrophosphohydrolase
VTDRDSGLGAVIDELYAVILERRDADPEASYTARLLSGPQDKLLKKIGDAAQVRYEAADLVYHLLVVLAREGVTPADLAAELVSRRA